jgi:hypothetical protein
VTPLAQTEWWRPEAPALAPRTGSESITAPDADTGSTLAFRALMAFTFVLVVAPQLYLSFLRPLRLALVSALVGIAAVVLHRLASARPVAAVTREMLLTAALAAWAVITVPLSYWPGGSAAFLFDLYFKAVAIFWLLAKAVDRVDRLRTVAWGLSLMGLPLAFTALRNYVSGAFLRAGLGDRIIGYQGALTSNPNDLALMLNLILPLTLALLAQARSAPRRALLVAMAVLQAAGVIVTFSRAGFLTLSVIVIVQLWRLARRGRIGWATVLLVMGLSASLLLPGGYLARLGTIVDIDSDRTGSAQLRWRDSVVAAHYVAAHPLIGAGAGMNTLALNEARGATWTKVHNAYLEYAVDLGLPGLLLFLALLFACFRTVRAVRQRAALDPGLGDLSALAAGLHTSLVAFAVAAFFHPIAYQFYFYYLAGLAVAASGICRRVCPPPQHLQAVA